MTFDKRLVTGEWDYQSLPDNVAIGDDCWLERQDSFARFRSVQQPGLVLGRGVQVYTWTSFNVEPTGIVEIGDDSTLVGAIFMCAGKIRLGRRVVVSYNVTLADSDFHPINPELRRRDAAAIAPSGDKSGRPEVSWQAIEIGDDVAIGVGAIVLKGVTIGDRACVRAGSVVTHSVAADATVAGNPAVPVVGREEVR